MAQHRRATASSTSRRRCGIGLALRWTQSPAEEQRGTSGARQRGPRAVAQALPIGRSTSDHHHDLHHLFHHLECAILSHDHLE
jgi:hypothetical protein